MKANKEVKVSTTVDGKMQQVATAVIPLFPETLEDVAKVFKATPEIALKCLQNGLTIDYQRVERAKHTTRISKPSKAKLEVIEKAKRTGWYKPEYETMNVRAITDDIMSSIPNK